MGSSSGRRTALTALLALVLAAGVLTTPTTASAAAKTVYIPARWTQTGEVPWAANRTRESTNFILLWGERSGTNPVSAPSPYNFDPNSVITQLENLYNFYVNTMRFTPETGLLAQHKIIVIITRTWGLSNLEAWATGGSVDGRVGIINIAPGAALPGSWGLAHELGHVFQNYTFLGRSGYGFTAPYAGTFWETSAEFMAMQALPTTAAGDLTRWLRSENLYWSSSRHHYGNWMLMQYIKDRDGLAMFNRLWNEARSTEHPLEVYRRITGISQAELNRRVGEYATRNVTWDFGNRSTLMPFIDNVYGSGFLTAYNGGLVEAVDAGAGHFRMNTRTAPSDYGFNKVKLVANSDGALVRVRVKGHAETGATGWAFGLVAVRNGTPRYSPLVVGTDGRITFQLQSGEREVWLVVTGAPANAVPHYAFLDGYNAARRYPYEFRVSGATPSGFEPGYVKPAATGNGHWHANGGGWVANTASVSASAYVGPKAAVYGRATVRDNARIEGLGWVNGGVVGGNAVVKDNALIQDGANLSGSVVVGGDAEIAIACSSGTYLRFNPDRRCDGQGGEADVNPSHGTFPTSDLSLS
ncbi:MAG: avirulence protein [Saccharothrix sp.]|nr:avirulence protein [Saccharothrix sp.]